MTGNDKQTVLLVGLGRSGTTWVGKIFDSHPNTLYVHEPDNWFKTLPLPLISPPGYQTEFNFTEYTQSLYTVSIPKVVGKLPYFPKQYNNAFQNVLIKFNTYLSKFIAKISIKIPIKRFISPKKRSRTILVWKSIESLGRLDLFRKSEAQIKIIHIVRHPCGYISSILRGERNKVFDSDFETSSDYGVFEMLAKTNEALHYKLDLDSFKKMSALERLSWRWILINEKAINDAKDYNDYLLLKYEDLCGNPVEKTKELYSFSNLSWNTQTESFVGKSTSTNNEQYYSIYKDPNHAAMKWKTELSADEIKIIMDIVNNSNLKHLYAD